MYVVYTSSHVAGSATGALYSHQHHRPGYGKRHVHVNCADGTCLFPRDCQGMTFSFLPS